MIVLCFDSDWFFFLRSHLFFLVPTNVSIVLVVATKWVCVTPERFGPHVDVMGTVVRCAALIPFVQRTNANPNPWPMLAQAMADSFPCSVIAPPDVV
jgi:hypothetical protein